MNSIRFIFLVFLATNFIAIVNTVNGQESSHIVRMAKIEIDSAYQSHIKTAHFLAYKDGVKNMVKTLELVDVNPILLKHKLKN